MGSSGERARIREGRGNGSVWETPVARRTSLTFQTPLAPLICSPSLQALFLSQAPLNALEVRKEKEGDLSPPCPETNFSRKHSGEEAEATVFYL